MQKSNYNPAVDNAPQRAARNVNETRRRLLRGGASAAPLILAITTRPAKASSLLACQTPSAWGSMNASRAEETLETCYGRTPEYWKDAQHYDKWPHPYYPTTVASLGGHSASRFHGIGCSGSYFGGKSMLEVLEMGTNSVGYPQLGAYVTAAVLNAASGMTPVLNVPACVNLWNECVQRGYYEATAGVRWSTEQVVRYIKTTIPV